MSRNRLHVDKVDDFKIWLKLDGWTEVKNKSCWEVFRMTKKGNEVLIVHTKLDAKVHLTLHGISESLFSKWMQFKRINAKKGKENE